MLFQPSDAEKRELHIFNCARDQHRQWLDFVETGVRAVEDLAVDIIPNVSRHVSPQVGQEIG